MKSAIVTGGAGFIGTRLVERMVQKGWSVYVVDDFSTHTTASSSLAQLDGVSFSNGRVQDHSYYKFNANPPDLIVHLAGKVGPLGVMRYSGNIALDTIEAADSVSKWAYEYKCPLIFISTSEVYGSDDESNKESDPTTIQLHSARSEYAASKLAAEHMLLNRASSTDWAGRLDVRVVRPFNIAGKGQRVDGGFVIPRFIEDLRAHRKIRVYQPGTQRRAFTHIDDFIDGIALVFTKGKSGEIYNIGNEANIIEIRALAEEVVARSGEPSFPMLYKIEIIDPTTLHGPDFREAPDKIPDSTKARTELGWRPFRDIFWIVKDVLEYKEINA